MDRVKIAPLEDRIVVKIDEAEKESPGGIVLPIAAQERPQRGTVLHVGPGRTLDCGTIKPMVLDVGDKIIVGKYAGAQVEIDGDELTILRESEVLVILR